MTPCGIIFYYLNRKELFMEQIIYDILFFLIVFAIIFTINYLVYLKKIKKGKHLEIVDYVVLRFNLDSKKINARRMILAISLINAFIISLVSTVITKLNIAIIWQFMIGFVLLFGLIYSLYEIYGKYLIKKGYKRKKEKIK